ncbi:hypothetical protein HDU67_010099 [Dinochytrium kinnereticum]|nr:hypothetical protein HDU67_010099 [Dinochytrium kinnereticum]
MKGLGTRVQEDGKDCDMHQHGEKEDEEDVVAGRQHQEQEERQQRFDEEVDRQVRERLTRLDSDKHCTFEVTRNPDGSFSMHSPQLVKLLGYPAQEDTNTSIPEFWRTLIHPEDMEQGFRRLLADDDSGFLAEIRVRKADGEWLPLLTSCAVSKRAHLDEQSRTKQLDVLRSLGDGLSGGEAGEGFVEMDRGGLAPVQWLGIHTDISDLKRVQRELSERLEEVSVLKEKAEEAAQAKSRFLANISHELRTPLTGILGLTDLLLEDYFQQPTIIPPHGSSPTTITSSASPEPLTTHNPAPPSPPNPRLGVHLHSIHRCAEGLLLIINDLLDFSRLEAKKLSITCHPFQVRRCVEGAILPVEHLVVSGNGKAGGLRVEVEIGEGCEGVVWGDEGRVRQVLLNLIGNAVKFSGGGAEERRGGGMERVGVGVFEGGGEGSAGRSQEGDGGGGRDVGGEPGVIRVRVSKCADETLSSPEVKNDHGGMLLLFEVEGE